MKKLITLTILITSICIFVQNPVIAIPEFTRINHRGDQIIEEAFVSKESDLQVAGQGTVIKILADDLEGSKHQRFVIQLSSGQTLLIAHNIDLAPRINNLQKGDLVKFYGEYEWNEQGGIIHWTHHDPNGKHIDGWLEHQGKKYE